VYDLALGDVVATDADYIVRRVLEPSGRYVFRAWFGASFHPRDEIASQLETLGALIESSSRNLLAIDAADGEHAQHVANLLAEREHAGHLIYESGASSSNGSER